MARISKTRGASYELEVCAAIESALGIPMKRKLGQARDSGNDIDLHRKDGTRFRMECKRRRSIAIYEWMQQAKDSCSAGDTPVVVCRGDNRKSMVILPLEAFLELAKSCAEDR